ncbi:hypothetical protein AURDEDRAFT_160869 [Auricularia subglabra TFB-10046 SS5]|nr:hypothetical protein AURDEDRAFT_160869 [Auricularia subglabra TFB-10046 SS5]
MARHTSTIDDLSRKSLKGLGYSLSAVAVPRSGVLHFWKLASTQQQPTMQTQHMYVGTCIDKPFARSEHYERFVLANNSQAQTARMVDRLEGTIPIRVRQL